MSDPLQHVGRGDPLRFRADVYNALVDLVRSNKLSEYMLGGRHRPDTSEGPITILVKNTTAAIVPQFGILKPTEPLILPTLNDTGWRERRAMKCIAPAASSPFVITQESIAPDAIGKAIVAGITPAFVNITDVAHTYAGPTSDPTKLTSGTGGPVRILHADIAGSNTKCIVQVTGAADASATGTGGGGGTPTFSGAKAYTLTGQTFPGPTNIVFEEELFDVGGYHAHPTPGGEFFTIPTDGYYLVGFELANVISLTDPGWLAVYIFRNAAEVHQQVFRWDNTDINNDAIDCHGTTLVQLASGDTISLLVWDGSAGGTNAQLIIPGSEPINAFWITRIGT